MGYLETYQNLVLGGMDPDEAAVEAAELENMYGDSEDGDEVVFGDGYKRMDLSPTTRLRCEVKF